MSDPNRSSITRKLPLSLAALVVFVTMIVTLVAYIEVRRGVMAGAAERLSHVTHQLQDMLESSARQTYATMSASASNGVVLRHLAAPAEESTAAVSAYLSKTFRPSATLRVVELWDAHGIPSVRSAPVPPLDATARAALVSALATSPLGFSGAYRVVNDTLESVAIVAIRSDSAVRGFLVQRRRLNSSPQAIKSLTELIGSNARLTIGSRAGDVWTDLTKVVPGIPRHYLTDSSVFRYQRATGERVIARAVPVRSTEWLVAVDFLEGPIFATASRFLKRALVVGLVLALGGVWVGVIISRQITKPLNQVTQAAVALAAGTDSTRVKLSRRDELGQLAASFNVMAEQIARGHNQLAGALERYRLLFERNPVPMWVFARETLAFLDVNEAAIKHYGYSRDEFLAMSLKDIRPPEDVPQLLAAAAEPLDQGESRLRRWKHRRKDGSLIDVEIMRTDIELQGQAAAFASATDISDRVAAETALALSREQIELQLSRLNALRAIDLAILGTTDLRLLLKSVLQEVHTQLKSDAAVIFLFNPHSLTVDTSASIGYRTRAAERERVRLGDGVAGRAAHERRTIAVPDLSQLEVSDGIRKVADDEGIRSVYALPLIAKGEVIGVLDVLFRRTFSASDDWLQYCEALAGQAAMAIESCRSFESLQRANLELSLAYDRTIEGWSRALDLRDKETEGHTQRVTEIAVHLARHAGISEAEIVHVRRGALLHDIGKMGVPDAILLKPGSLSDDEWTVMRMHPVFAVELLSPIEYLRPALDIPYCHHEKWDGTGYPRRLKGEQIPLAARLFSVIDVWDALRSDRPYRAAWPEAKVREHLRSLVGTAFDPKAVDFFLRMLEEEGEEAVLSDAHSATAPA